MHIARQAMIAWFFFVTGISLLAAPAVDAPHVHVELLIPRNKLYAHLSANYAGIHFRLERGWHIYWKNPGDAGEPPHAVWELPAGITAEELQFPAPQRLRLSSLMDYGYENEFLLPLKLHIGKEAAAGRALLHAKVDWLVCQNSCIPGRADLDIACDIDVVSHPLQTVSDPLFQRFFSRIPRPFPGPTQPFFQATKGSLLLTLETGQPEHVAAFFPADPYIIDNPSPQKLTPTSQGLVLRLKKDAALSTALRQLRGVVELSGGRAYEIVAHAATSTTSATANASANINHSIPPVLAATAAPSRILAANATSSASWIALARAAGLAFLGGVLLNLMPCVFPVLFLKGLSLLNSGQQELHRLRRHGLAYAAGILFSFWSLVAVLLILRAAGAILGWGFQFQSPVFLALVAELLFFLGLSLAGEFELGLALTGTGTQLASKEGYAGSFFTGVLAVVVATPCTAPLMGTAIGYALTQQAPQIFTIFTFLALGLAAPYLLLTAHPAWTHHLPRPGAWMELLRQACAVPLFATVIWLAWILVHAYGATALAALLTGFLLLAIAGWFLGRWPARRSASLIAAGILAAVVALAFYSQHWAEVSTPLASPAGKSDDSSLPSWQPWSEEAVRHSLAQDKPVFVDFTASWCLSCQVNERAALQQPQVQQAFHRAQVVLLRADWTRHDESITRALTALGRSGVPAYALYLPGQTAPLLLPEVLTSSTVINALPKPPHS
jgi:thiol:disulfide interchange protein DsbD